MWKLRPTYVVEKAINIILHALMKVPPQRFPLPLLPLVSTHSVWCIQYPTCMGRD